MIITTSLTCSLSINHSQQSLTVSEYDYVWNLKLELIDRVANLKKQLSYNNSNKVCTNELNYGLYCPSIAAFLEEDITFGDVLKDLLNCDYCKECLKKNIIDIEFRYKQRIDIMSTTLPTSTTTRRKRKKSRLLEAVSNGNVEKIIKLLANCDPNFIDESSGETPLSLSANTTSQSTTTTQRVIVALVNGGAHLDFRTKDGRTALHCAVQKSNYAALKTFLDLGASPNYKDANGLTPLFYSIIYKSNPKLTQLLLHEHSAHGIVDQHGWQEVHHACKLGLVAHLEQLLYYGCDMNCKIVGSGNTPLHVAAINDQMECARVLLLRGCNTSIVNNSHQNAYQVAVISGNMNLADLIANHKVENVVPYRDKPKYNPARRPPSSKATSGDPAKQQQQRIKEEFTAKYLNGGTPTPHSFCCPPSSPCLSQRSCATSTTISTTTTSSGVCCELDGSQSEEAGDEEGESEEESTKTEKAASQKTRVEGRREQKKLGIGSSTTLPARGRRAQNLMTNSVGSMPVTQNAADLISQSMPPITSYDEKTVSLHKGKKGFGFVLRGAKASSPVMKQAQETATQPQPISLQYLDEIEPGGVAEASGLRKGDFLLNVNGVDVRSAPHEHVVNLIRQSGDKVTMTVASPIYLQLDAEEEKKEKDKNLSKEEVQANGDIQKTVAKAQEPTGNESSENVKQRSTSKSRAPPPAPPRRDPSTTLSIGRARARSICISSTLGTDSTSASTTSSGGNNEIAAKLVSDNYDSEGRSTKSSSPTTSVESMVVNTQQVQSKDSSASKIASIRTRGSRRISAFELEEFFARQSDGSIEKKHAMEGSQKMTTLQALKKKKKKKLQKGYHSTPDIQQELMLEEQQAKDEIDSSLKQHRRLSTSQEDLNRLKNQLIYSETLTLKNGKIVQNDEQQSRAPPPSYPPPPPPKDQNQNLLSVVVKVDVGGKQSKSDYANFAQMQGDAQKSQSIQPLSSFKPPPLPPESDSGETTPKAVRTATDSTKQQSTQPQQTGILRKVKHPNTRGTTPSLYARQDTIESLDDEPILQQPFIPEPDYSSTDDDADTPTNVSSRDLSTFKSTTAIPVSATMTQSFPGANNGNSSKPCESLAKKNGESVKAKSKTQVQIESSDMAINIKQLLSSPSKPKTSVDEKLTFEKKSESKRIFEDKTPSEPINKVKESIQIFERRSSLSSDSGSVSASVTKPKKDSQTSIQTESNSAANANNLRMSKSCFEVDCCDNSSSGVSSDVDGDVYSQQPHSLGSIFAEKVCNPLPTLAKHQQMHSLNRRNSAIVSEKIANLMAQTQQTSKQFISEQTKQQQQQHQQQAKHALQQAQQRRASIACPTETTNASQPSTTTAIMHTTTVTVTTTTTATAPAKAAPTMTKTWSEISSQIRAAKGEPIATTATKAKNASQPSQAQTKSKSGSDAAVRVQVDSLGLAAVNEVDVLSELVPPPPEFAAPPPQSHDKMQSQQSQKVQQQIRANQRQSASPQPKKEEIRILTPQSHHPQQHHIVHKPTPTTASLQQRNLCDSQTMARKTATPPPPPPPEFSDMSAAARLGIAINQHAIAQQSQNPQYHHPYLQQHHNYQQQQQFATLTRYCGKQSAASMKAGGHNNSKHYLTLSRADGGLESTFSCSSMSPQQYLYQTTQASQNHQNYHQFATLTRSSRSGASTPVNAASLYSDYTRLTVQNRLLRQQHPYQTQQGCQQPHDCQSQQQQSKYAQNAHQQQLQQQQQQQQPNAVPQNQPPQPSQPPPPGPPPSLQKHYSGGFQRKSMVDWTPEDVSDWLISIGMAEHKSKFEFISGVKLLRLDNNDLMGIGIRQGQHRCYILEKMKQHLHYQQQHPPPSQ
ncbi:ankyrin repeat domain containing protein 35-like protein [Dinothrombium tinctorium]|uniref:Ankyrin repeat domain containing protein 35-like protein n=1 Tax=Dinothrombium tinctorium TaxID=1965070 RepID=A0A3S4RIR8_9ACAR|nr:ankyrin repeat domain containing protein 35-like protein [Dinothrombium tinctorium]